MYCYTPKALYNHMRGSLLNHHQCAASTWMMRQQPQDNGASALTTHQLQVERRDRDIEPIKWMKHVDGRTLALALVDVCAGVLFRENAHIRSSTTLMKSHARKNLYEPRGSVFDTDIPRSTSKLFFLNFGHV